MKNYNNKKSSPAVIFIIIFTIMMLTTLGVTLFSQKTNRENIISTFKINSKNQVEIQKQIMNSDLQTIETDLLFLPKLNEVLRFKELENENDRKQIESEYLEFSKSSGNYDQIRYINSAGIEVMRVNYNNGNPTATPKEKLQDKSSRYYFKETISIPNGSIYISPFDLNIEQGKIEQPLKPMIRFGTPVYNIDRDIKGIVILNFLGQNLLDNLEKAIKTNPGTYSLLNSDGYWLYNNNPEEEWGFMYDNKQDLKLTKTDPELWSKILSSSYTQIMTEQALYTAEKIYIGQENQGFDNAKFYILLNTIKTEEMNIDKRHLRTKLNSSLIAAAIINTLLSIFLTRVLLQRNNYRKALKESALYDQLTGLPNRNLLEERGKRTAAHAQRYKHIYAVMFLDIDGFKSVNDTFGHNIGDKLLQKIAAILNSSIRETDTAARFGGDEFIILLSIINSVNDCKIVAEKILSQLSKEIIINGNSIMISGSIGVIAALPESEATYDEVVLAADAAMYEIKKSGKNNYKIRTI